MKHWFLKKLCDEILHNSSILSISRIKDNCFWILFDKSGGFLFDLENKNIYLSEQKPQAKHFNAPFDAWVLKNINKSKILNAHIDEFDKILSIDITAQDSYKLQEFTLVFEFIPPRGNLIITQKNSCIVALRYDDRVKIKKDLTLPKRPPNLPDAMPIIEIDKSFKMLLEQNLVNLEDKKLQEIKKRKIAQIDSKISRLNSQLNELLSDKELMVESMQANALAQIITVNLASIDTKIGKHTLNDFNGNTVEVDFFANKTAGEWKDYFFTKSKKLKQKAQGVQVRYENISQKITFWTALKNLIELADDESKVLVLDSPKSQKSKISDEDWHEIFINNAKIMIGKNSIGNEKLLKLAKADDLWFHLQDIPSAHVLLKGTKKTENLIQEAANYCVLFSVFQKGSYLVDYTQRKNVSPIGGSNVKYINYKSIKIDLR